MNYVRLLPPTRAAEDIPALDIDLFEDRGIPVSLRNLTGSAFAMEAYDSKGKIEGSLIWVPGLNFDEITQRKDDDKDARSTCMDDPDEDGL